MADVRKVTRCSAGPNIATLVENRSWPSVITITMWKCLSSPDMRLSWGMPAWSCRHAAGHRRRRTINVAWPRQWRKCSRAREVQCFATSFLAVRDEKTDSGRIVVCHVVADVSSFLLRFRPGGSAEWLLDPPRAAPSARRCDAAFRERGWVKLR